MTAHGRVATTVRTVLPGAVALLYLSVIWLFATGQSAMALLVGITGIPIALGLLPAEEGMR